VTGFGAGALRGTTQVVVIGLIALAFSAPVAASARPIVAPEPSGMLTARTPLASGIAPEMAKVGETVIFAARDGVHGRELWKTNGTKAGTVMVKNIRKGGPSYPEYLTVVGRTVFFRADDGMHGVEMWKSDGTKAGTVSVKNFGKGSGPVPEVAVGRTLYLDVFTQGHGYELWKSDGTRAGTLMVKEILQGRLGALDKSLRGGTPNPLTAMGGTIYFKAADGQHGRELWKSDGTRAGTVMVKDIQTGKGSNPENLTTSAGTLFFTANDGVHGYELWKSDGTRAGTVMVKNIGIGIGSRPRGLTSAGGVLYFSASSVDAAVRELWRTDGTPQGTTQLKVLTGYHDELTNVGGTLFFADANSIWKTDGTEAGTTEVIALGTGHRYRPDALTGVGSRLFFTSDHPDYGREWWTSDGTAAGTSLLKNINPGTGSSALSPVQTPTPGRPPPILDGSLLLNADDGTTGNELWMSDGTSTGTRMVKDINPSGDSNPFWPPVPKY
jgi:ELWxxDGT repeat protein